MRPHLIAGAVAGLVALSAAAGLGGRPLVDAAARAEQAQAAATIVAAAVPGGDEATSAASAAAAPQPMRDSSGLERVKAREPLSKLSLALPPKPKMPDEWKGTVMFGAVAKAAGVIEAKGYAVAIAGTDAVDADETCTYAGKSWDCGIRARTAFRAFLRGRAPNCVLPPEADRAIISAPCMIGKQDVGRWLVSNGWVRGVAGGPYVDDEAKARQGKRGIFGPPPSRNGLPALPVSDPPIEATVRDSIEAPETVTDGKTSPSFVEITPPADLPGPSQ